MYFAAIKKYYSCLISSPRYVALIALGRPGHQDCSQCPGVPGKRVLVCVAQRGCDLPGVAQVVDGGAEPACPLLGVFLPPGSHRSARFVPSAGCFFGDEVRGSGESCAPSDTDASSDAERPGPDQPVPAESLDCPGDPKGSSASGPGTSRTTEHPAEVASPATQTPRPEPRPGPACTPAEVPWTNIDLKEPKKTPSHPLAGLPETTGLSSLEVLPLGLEEPYGADDHPLWAWVSGGGCAVEAHSVLKWFSVQLGKGLLAGPPPQRVSPGGGGQAMSCLNAPLCSACLSAAF